MDKNGLIIEPYLTIPSGFVRNHGNWTPKKQRKWDEQVPALEALVGWFAVKESGLAPSKKIMRING